MVVSGGLDVFFPKHCGRNNGDIIAQSLGQKLLLIRPTEVEIAKHEIEIEVLRSRQPGLIEDHISHVKEMANIRVLQSAAEL